MASIAPEKLAAELYKKRNRVQEIIPDKLYATSLKGVTKENVALFGIETIVSLGVLADHEIYDSVPNVITNDIPDRGGDLKPVLRSAIDRFDHEHGGKMLVHCQWGVNRTGAIVTALLMHHFKIGWDEALHRARKGRPFLDPSEEYKKQVISHFVPHNWLYLAQEETV